MDDLLQILHLLRLDDLRLDQPLLAVRRIGEDRQQADADEGDDDRRGRCELALQLRAGNLVVTAVAGLAQRGEHHAQTLPVVLLVEELHQLQEGRIL